MSMLKKAAEEVIGLFIDDGSLAAATLVWALLGCFLIPRLPLPFALKGILFFAGIAFILMENIIRSLRNQRF